MAFPRVNGLHYRYKRAAWGRPSGSTQAAHLLRNAATSLRRLNCYWCASSLLQTQSFGQ